MSINMYVSASQRQAASVSNMCKQQVQGYDQLQKAINDFTLNSPFLTGEAYDSAKKYFSSVLYPLAQAGILLSEAVERAVKKFPETYVAQVDSGNLIQAELEMKIREVNSLLVQAEGIQRNLMLLNVPHLDGMRTAQLSANSTLIHMYGGVKKKLEEKLQKLIAFNSSSPSIFSEIASLQQAVNQGLAQTKTAWNASSGTFTVPNTEALSWTKGIQEKWKDYVKRHEPKIEVRAEKVNKGSVGEHTHYNVYVDGVYDEDKTKELRWMFDKESFKESAHFIGDFVFINDIYQSVTGEDWLSGEEGSRTAAAGMLVLSVLPTKKLENIAKALKGGKKTLKGVELTEKEEKVLKEAGLLDKIKSVEKASEAKGTGEINYVHFNKTHKDSLPKPKGDGPNGGRLQSHHGLQQEWAKNNFSQYGYDSKLAPTITIETGKGLPHTIITNAQTARRNERMASGVGKWSTTLQEELQFMVGDLTKSGFSRDTTRQVLEHQYKMLDKLGVKYERIDY
ncbi:T7SS effector LXG polymorphic toxin [Bacillus mycoides]|uniref:T7SS effector LXG polymorphic toxin n=1 Tax=Bacillus mycoides TaxID=1405 RepID=UPI0036E80B1A